jgi:biotin carboxyl carrier protein
MPPTPTFGPYRRAHSRWVFRATSALLVLTSLSCAGAADRPEANTTTEPAVAPGSLRLAGTVEAVRSWTVSVPRLAGQSLSPLIITYLVPPGTRVEPGDLLVTFDPQEQERVALDRQAEVVDLDGQIARKRSEQASQEAKDQTELTKASNDVERAKLDVRKNDHVARVEAEKNTLALEQAIARHEQLSKTFALKRKAAAADLRILEIRRERAEAALEHARENAGRMEVHAPFAGLVVIKRIYRNGAFVEILEGDDVRPGVPIIDIVDTSVMQVRAAVNQADAGLVREGQTARVGLDGFPELIFDGRVQLVAPLGVASSRSPTVRSLTAVVSIDGADPQLLPDLSAWVELMPASETPATEPGTGGPR